nr:restriction endonuclease subunit S [Weissella confusa]
MHSVSGAVEDRQSNEAQVWSLGLLQMDFFYRERRWYAGQFVRKVIPLFTVDKLIALYMETILQKLKPVLLSVLVRNVDETFLSSVVKLPIDQNGQIDWEFMRRFIAQSRNQYLRIAKTEIDALMVSDTVDESNIDSIINSFSSKKHAKFELGQIFEKLQAGHLGEGDKFDAVSKVKSDEFTAPVVYAKFGDNGIMYWARENEFVTYSNVISVVYNGAIAVGKVYPQKHATGILAESYFIRIKDVSIPFEANIYLAKVIEKTLYPKYSREFLATWDNKVEFDEVNLPVTDDGVPDYAFMADYIKALEIRMLNRVGNQVSE